MTYEEAKAEAIRRSRAEWSQVRLHGRRRFILIVLSLGCAQYLGSRVSTTILLFVWTGLLVYGHFVGATRRQHKA